MKIVPTDISLVINLLRHFVPRQFQPFHNPVDQRFWLSTGAIRSARDFVKIRVPVSCFWSGLSLVQSFAAVANCFRKTTTASGSKQPFAALCTKVGCMAGSGQLDQKNWVPDFPKVGHCNE